MTDDLTQRLFQLTVADNGLPCYEAIPPAASTAQTPSNTSADTTLAAPPRKSKKPGAYVVFLGQKAGVYTNWDDCRSQVTGIKHNSYLGYKTMNEARAAFEAARGRGLTFSFADATATVGQHITETRLSIEDLVLCTAFMDDATSVAMAPSGHLWYVVFQGVQPGVYRTYHEAMLSTTGLKGAALRSYRGRDEAVGAFKIALESGEVRKLTRG
ncbi:hypothetical protein BD626DRAFT_414228 [Schizophyllum amplum]|uniref:Ribonuclease H1 N-terminal domain-containing protein n=1 Tax=Schizophyllum amplum TaxID=97359 RepID=A0A550BUZ2_9AGAR|nr:hypothetical protein BD626DRAFT_414228 [Auriculariopsis ampla]